MRTRSARISLDGDYAEAFFQRESRDQLDSAENFDRQWAVSVMETAVRRLRSEWVRADKGRMFDNLWRLIRRAHDEVAWRSSGVLGIDKSVVKSELARLRRRFSDCVREEVAKTVMNPAQAKEEFAHLLETLRG